MICWFKHEWEDKFINSIKYRTCTKCGQNQESIIGRWLDIDEIPEPKPKKELPNLEGMKLTELALLIYQGEIDRNSLPYEIDEALDYFQHTRAYSRLIAQHKINQLESKYKIIVDENVFGE